MGPKGGFSGLTNVHDDGAIIIPAQVRSRLGLKPHDHLLFQLKGEHIIAYKVRDEVKGYYVGVRE
ncbi:MAG: AbrB/MazE/SpoVT family DNA-binding domain-containing protein [Firmicutes bacterium]|nr:AbrB/MazE/SpoVT family DNA-binding domain-containing protein [Bacillota bacterium]